MASHVRCPFVRLGVRDRYGALVEPDFRVDTQADFTSIPVATARKEHIAFSERRERRVAGLVGETTAYCDHVHVVIAGRTYDWPCDFVNTPSEREAAAQPRVLPPTLGRAGFLGEYAVHIEGEYLTITRIGPIRQWLRRHQEGLWKFLGLVHPPDRPL